ncbi:MAG: 1,4-dihydroxy-2-naphthoate polyprenyltransferase [Myxococcota bacterium]|nr:1,4-dihydroxy-2-naphthoate polyprenyltransferase [Myxococcota bacterium]
MTANQGHTLTKAQIWVSAIRPATLWAGAVPVFVGAALAAAAGYGPGTSSILALVGALLIQVGTNLVNDYADFKTGADGPDRLGPKRATSEGWLKPRQVLAAALITLLCAGAVGVYLSTIGGAPILVLGIVSIVCAVAYTAGPVPLAYVGLGDVFVLAFFGVAAVAGTFYLETGFLDVGSVIAGLIIGALATMILVVNNLRDRVGDKRVGKRTLAVRFGPRFTRIQYLALCIAAYALTVYGVYTELFSQWTYLVGMTIPLAVSECRAVLKKDGQDLNPHLGGAAKLELAFGLLFCVGVVI